MSAVSLYACWCAREHTPLTQATAQDLARWFSVTVQRKARNTAVNQMLSVRNFCRWLIRRGFRTDDPTSAIPSTRDRIEFRQPYQRQELHALLDAARHGCYQRARPLRDVALLSVFIDSAARRAEVLGLQACDIDWERGQLRIRHAKGGHERRVALGTQTMQALAEYVGDRQGPVWLNAKGLRLTEPRAYELLRLIAAEAGVIGATLHRFRTTTANMLLEAGMALDELQLVLGHRDIQTTARYSGYSAATRALVQQRQLSVADGLARTEPISLADRVAG